MNKLTIVPALIFLSACEPIGKVGKVLPTQESEDAGEPIGKVLPTQESEGVGQCVAIGYGKVCQVEFINHQRCVVGVIGGYSGGIASVTCKWD